MACKIRMLSAGMQWWTLEGLSLACLHKCGCTNGDNGLLAKAYRWNALVTVWRCFVCLLSRREYMSGDERLRAEGISPAPSDDCLTVSC
jgi:hypothetical protein